LGWFCAFLGTYVHGSWHARVPSLNFSLPNGHDVYCWEDLRSPEAVPVYAQLPLGLLRR